MAPDLSDDSSCFTDEAVDRDGEALLEADEVESSLTYLSPVDEASFSTRADLIEHLRTKYDIDLNRILYEKSPLAAQQLIQTEDAFLLYCALINFLRRRKCEEKDSAWSSTIAQITPNSEFWRDESYLKPVLVDDPLIRYWDGWQAIDSSDESSLEYKGDPYSACPLSPASPSGVQPFMVFGETAPSADHLKQQERNIRELGGFDD